MNMQIVFFSTVSAYFAFALYWTINQYFRRRLEQKKWAAYFDNAINQLIHEHDSRKHTSPPKPVDRKDSCQ